MENDFHHNMHTRRAQDQVEHDFVRESGLPRDYFQRRSHSLVGDALLLVALLALIALAYWGL